MNYSYDILLNLDFLKTNYIEFFKNLSFAVFIGVMVLIVLLIIANLFKKDSIIQKIFYIFFTIACGITLIISLVLLFSFIFYIPCYFAALLKNFITSRYLVISFTENLLVNIVCAAISSYIYAILISKSIKNILDN